LATSTEAEARSLFRLCAQGQWDYSTALHELGKGTWRSSLGRIHYRPFDTRWTVFERHVAVHLRERVTRHMRAGSNLALAVGRAGQVINGGDNWDIVFCSRLPTEFNLYRRGGNYLFPLYLYPTNGTARMANLAPHFIAEISQRLALNWLPDGSGDLLTTFGPDDIFAYIYAFLYAPSYRTRYANFLKIDFPRIPLPTRIDLFRVLCSSGHALSQAHLLEQPFSTNMAWSHTDDNLVEHVHYFARERGGCVSINAHQHLDCVPHAAWTLTIGGHQIAKKWLWDRRGRRLGAGELAQYCQIIASLLHTREAMAAIDRAIAHHGGWPLSP
jgi:predicted helicase